jgi:hypothetical protein
MKPIDCHVAPFLVVRFRQTEDSWFIHKRLPADSESGALALLKIAQEADEPNERSAMYMLRPFQPKPKAAGG